MKTLGEFARGADAPTVPPVWDRHLLTARVPPRVSHTHREYDEADTEADAVSHDRVIHRSFFFGPLEISAKRRFIPPDLRSRASTFEMLTSLLWRCRTIAQKPIPNAETRVICVVNARPKLNNPRLPRGYYGNVVVFPVAIASAKDLSQQPLGFALRLIENAKSSVTEEYVRSAVDLLVTRGRPHFSVAGTYMVSDFTRAGFRDVDFGWGKAEYGGPAKAGEGVFPEMWSFYAAFKNKKGEDGIVVAIGLPEPAMERFVEELDRVLGKKHTFNEGNNERIFATSSL